MPLRMLCLTVILGFACQARAEELVFKKRGQLVKKADVSSIPSELKVNAEVINVWEPLEERERKYKGFPVNALFKAAYGNDWQKTEEVLFTCQDGYQAPVSVERFKTHTAYLVYETPGSEFVVNNRFQKEKAVPLGPYYLVWENIKDKQMRKEGERDRPYQIVSTDLIQFAERYPTIAPPAHSSALVKRGFVVYRERCMTCHKLNGEGGDKGPELNYPVSVTEYIKENWLEKWIMDPTSIRANSTMPTQTGLMTKTDVKELVAYLKAMAKNKKAPVERTEEAPK